MGIDPTRVPEDVAGLSDILLMSPAPEEPPTLDDDIPVAAKTGTAQLNGPDEPERSHAWIVAFAPVEQPEYANAD